MAVVAEEPGDIRAWERMSLLVIAVLFILIRLPLYSDPGVLLGWNSDAALFGLMARAMSAGSDFPPFFWGQFYLGTLTSLCTAAAGLVMDVGPLALRVVVAIEVALSAFLFWLALRRTFGSAGAMLATFWVVAGPSFLFDFTVAPIGAEQLFLAAAVLFWYVTRSPLASSGAWFVAGLISGVGLWLHQGIAFLGAGIAVALFVERIVRPPWIALFAAGAALGYVPAGISLLRNDPLLYKRQLLSWNLPRVFGNFAETVRGDLWLLLADASPFGIGAGVILIGFAILGFRGERWTRARIIAVSTIAVSAAFWILSTYPYPGAVRYVVPVVPLVYGAAASGIVKWWDSQKARRVIAVTAAAVITLALYIPRIRQATDVAAGRSELYTNWPGNFDPRPALAQLKKGGFHVCYGEVWVAHKLEWLSSPTVRFVPVRLVHRTLRQSLLLIEHPGPKCYVENDGRVRVLSAAEDAYWADTVRLRAYKAGLLARFTPAAGQPTIGLRATPR